MLNKYEDILLVNLDKLTYAGNLENLKELEEDSRHIFVRGDICDKVLVAELFDKYDFDYVINFEFSSRGKIKAVDGNQRAVYTIDKLNTLFKNILLEKNYINQEPINFITTISFISKLYPRRKKSFKSNIIYLF